MAVMVVCSSEICCAEYYSWVLHVIRANVQGTLLEDTSQQVDSSIVGWM